MLTIPITIITPEDKIKFLYRTLELWRLDHNARGVKYHNREITDADWKKQCAEDDIKLQKIYDEIYPLRVKIGLFDINVREHPEVLDDPKYHLKESGKIETKWDMNIDLTQI